jgi:hypothetical protein
MTPEYLLHISLTLSPQYILPSKIIAHTSLTTDYANATTTHTHSSGTYPIVSSSEYPSLHFAAASGRISIVCALVLNGVHADGVE